MTVARIARDLPRRAGLALVLVLVLLVGGFLALNVVLEMKLGSAERVTLTLADGPSGGGANYLLVGSDTRAFVTDPADAQAFGETGDAGGQRSDTIMVLHTVPGSPRALLVSFPRDTWVDISGRGSAKLNAAFNDGPQAVIDTLAVNFDVPIHHYIEVNFDSFRQLVDAVGTVPVYFPVPARDELSGLGVGFPGCVPLDGGAALAFVRSRHLELLDPESGEWELADPIPDLGRIERQQAFLRVLGSRAMDEALTNPFQANRIVDELLGGLTLDDDFGRTDVFRLADALAPDGNGGADAGGPESQTLPTTPATRSGQAVLVTTSDADALLARLRDFESFVPAGDATAASVGDTRVEVLNASGVDGAAAEALAALTAQGFVGAGTGNADAPLQETEVHFRPGADDEAALVAGFVGGPVRLVEDDGVDGADVTLILGRSFDGITQPSPGASAPGAPSSPTSVSSSPAPIGQRASLAPVPGEC
jgi:LCP family protein required for cell wall assembly